MDLLGALWHTLNFLAPAAGLGILSAAMAKMLWRRELRGVGLATLSAWAGGASVFASVGGLIITGHDGKMSTYAAMVVACALGLWWVGWHRR